MRAAADHQLPHWQSGRWTLVYWEEHRRQRHQGTDQRRSATHTSAPPCPEGPATCRNSELREALDGVSGSRDRKRFAPPRVSLGLSMCRRATRTGLVHATLCQDGCSETLIPGLGIV